MSLFNKNLIFGALFYGVGIIFTISAFRFGELSVVGPVLSLVYVWVTFISIKFLNEKVNIWRYFGIGLVVIGLVLIGVA